MCSKNTLIINQGRGFRNSGQNYQSWTKQGQVIGKQNNVENPKYSNPKSTNTEAQSKTRDKH